MIKNEKGYLLAESIIVITVVATVITMVYAMIMDYYTKQDNEVTKYNTVQGLYTSKQIEKYFSSREDLIISNIGEQGYVELTDDSQNNNFYKNQSELFEKLNISKIYFLEDKKSAKENIITDSKLPINVRKFLNTKDDKNECNYRYILVFTDNSYSTIGVDCNEE